MKLTSLLAGLSFFSILFLSFTKPEQASLLTPKPGTTKVIVRDIEYYSGTIEGGNTAATWPVAKFTIDENAVKYSVKILKTGTTYTWEYDEKAQSAYSVFPASGDIKSKQYYIGLGRTWSAESTQVNAQWENNYRTQYGTENKVEITIYY